MFTGLIEATGTVRALTPVAGGQRLTIDTPLGAELGLGDSVSTNGVCLTVVAQDATSWSADVSPETLRVTALGALAPGSPVNLERPLAVGSRLGGHFVQGHVDGTGTVDELRVDGDSYWLTVLFPPSLASFIVRKGSIAVNGISLTVAGVDDRQFDVQIIPFTWTHTNLRGTRAGDTVNLECDILGKYVARAVELAAVSGRVRGAETTP